MRRRLLIGIGALVGLGTAAAAWVRLGAGGPVQPFPGGWLRGDLQAEAPADWDFAAAEAYLDVESRAGLLPYSATVWFQVHEGRIHLLLPSLFGDGLQRRLERDPRIRVRVDGRIWELEAVRVEGDEVLGALVGPMMRRQLAIDLGREVTRLPATQRPAGVDMWVYRLESRRET